MAELLGRAKSERAASLSASSLVRLKATWQAQYAAPRQCDLSDCQLIYLWADGVYVKVGLDTRKTALLALIRVDAAGQKHVLAVTSGERESTESWAAVLRHLKWRGLRAPKLTIAVWASRDLGQVRRSLSRERGTALLESQTAEWSRRSTRRG